jgi:hypothetical protein
MNLTTAFSKGKRGITEGIRFSLATGNWGKPHAN